MPPGSRVNGRPLVRLLPFLAWIGELRHWPTLRADVVAGVSVALVLVPQSMAYAQLAGLPVQYGLYAGLLPPIVAVLFGSSRQLSTGPVAVVSLMTAAALGPLAGGDPAQYLAFALLLAVLVGVFQVSVGFLRVGIVMDFLSHPVIIGFTNASAIIIATSQIGMILGVSFVRSDRHYASVWSTLEAAQGHIHYPTLGMAVLALTMLVTLKRLAPKAPAILLTVGVSTLLSYLLDFQGLGGRVVGAIPVGLPDFAAPAFDGRVLFELFEAAITISLVGFMEAMAIAKVMALRTGQSLDANQELIGQGLANIVAGVTSGYPVSGSFSRSAVNFSSGAKTGFSSIVTGIVVGASLLWLTPLLHHLPQATLAVVIVMAVTNLFKVAPVIHAWKAKRDDGIVAVVTFCATLIAAPKLDAGILAGVGLSLLLFMLHSMRPRFAVVSRFQDGTFRDIEVHNLPTSEKISVVRFDGPLYFGNASYFEEQILNVVGNCSELEFVILDGQGINHVDATGDHVLRHLIERLRSQGVELLITRMKKQCMDTVRRTGLLRDMGEDRFFSSVSSALEVAWDRLGDSYDRTSCPLRSPGAALFSEGPGTHGSK